MNEFNVQEVELTPAKAKKVLDVSSDELRYLLKEVEELKAYIAFLKTIVNGENTQ